MGQGWKVGENEMGTIVTTLGEGNLVDKQPVELTGVATIAAPAVVSDVDIAQIKADIDAIKLKLGM